MGDGFKLFVITYALYLIRWQASTPILAFIMWITEKHTQKKWVQAAIANLIGGLFFFWVDRLIFRK